jgi:hypothetical protein
MALVLRSLSTAAVRAMLDELRHAVIASGRAVVLRDRAGCARRTHAAVLLTGQPRLIERLFLYLRERFLSCRLWPSYDDILDA